MLHQHRVQIELLSKQLQALLSEKHTDFLLSITYIETPPVVAGVYRIPLDGLMQMGVL